MVNEINGNYSMGFSKGNGVTPAQKSQQSINIDFTSHKSEVSEKSPAEILGFEKKGSNVPKRQVNPNDKRPDVDNNLWNWMYGDFSEDGENISNLKQRRSITTFKLTSDQVEVDKNGNIISKNQESNVQLWRDDKTTKITVSSYEFDKNGNRINRVKEYFVDNKSGKLLSEGNYLNGKGLRYNYSEDGTFTTENVEHLIEY